jgi:hypothetical protein
VDEALLDDRKLTTEDIDETLLAAAGLALIWRGDFLLARIPGLPIVEGIVIAGGVASYAIGGTEGVLNYVDFITDKDEWLSLGIPTTLEYSLPIIYDEVIEPEIVDPIVSKINQGVDFAEFLYNVGEKKTKEGLDWAVGNLRNPFGIY